MSRVWTLKMLWLAWQGASLGHWLKKMGMSTWAWSRSTDSMENSQKSARYPEQLEKESSMRWFCALKGSPSSQIYICVWQAVQATWPIFLYLLLSRVMHQAIFSETEARRSSATIRGYARVQPCINAVVWNIPFCQIWLRFFHHSHSFLQSSCLCWS